MGGYDNDAVLRDWESKYLDPDYDFGLYNEEEEDDSYLDFLYDQFVDDQLDKEYN